MHVFHGQEIPATNSSRNVKRPVTFYSRRGFLPPKVPAPFPDEFRIFRALIVRGDDGVERRRHSRC